MACRIGSRRIEPEPTQLEIYIENIGKVLMYLYVVFFYIVMLILPLVGSLCFAESAYEIFPSKRSATKATIAVLSFFLHLILWFVVANFIKYDVLGH